MGLYKDHILTRKRRLSLVGLPQTKDDSDVLFTTRADGKITIRTCVCEACGEHFQTEIWCDIEQFDVMDDLIVLGRRAIGEQAPNLALQCTENDWATRLVEDAREMHDRAVDGFDAAMLERLERALSSSNR